MDTQNPISIQNKAVVKLKESLRSLLGFLTQEAAIIAGFFAPLIVIVVFFLVSLLFLDGKTGTASYLTSMFIAISIASLNLERYIALVKDARKNSFAVKKVPHLASSGRVYRVDRLVFSLPIYFKWIIGGFIFHLGLPVLTFFVMAFPNDISYGVRDIQNALGISGWSWVFSQILIMGASIFFLKKLFESSSFWLKFAKGLRFGIWGLVLLAIYSVFHSIFSGGIY